MRTTSILGIAITVATAVVGSAPASAATQIGNGTVSSIDFYNPVINLAVTPATYTTANSFFGPGATFQTMGTGAFTDVTGLFGTMTGTLSFSKTVGVTIAETVANFFTFNDGHSGTYNFSVASVLTTDYKVTAPTKSITLYLLGTTLDANLAKSATPTSVTLQFNSTGGSAWSASSTLAVPPATPPSVPEPSTWALGVIGFGAMGFMMRRRTRTAVTFA